MPRSAANSRKAFGRGTLNHAHRVTDAYRVPAANIRMRRSSGNHFFCVGPTCRLRKPRQPNLSWAGLRRSCCQWNGRRTSFPPIGQLPLPAGTLPALRVFLVFCFATSADAARWHAGTKPSRWRSLAHPCPSNSHLAELTRCSTALTNWKRNHCQPTYSGRRWFAAGDLRPEVAEMYALALDTPRESFLLCRVEAKRLAAWSITIARGLMSRRAAERSGVKLSRLLLAMARLRRGRQRWGLLTDAQREGFSAQITHASAPGQRAQRRHCSPMKNLRDSISAERIAVAEH